MKNAIIFNFYKPSEYEWNTELKFGRYIGKQIDEVYSKDPNYVMYCFLNYTNFIVSLEIKERLKSDFPNKDRIEELYLLKYKIIPMNYFIEEGLDWDNYTYPNSQSDWDDRSNYYNDSDYNDSLDLDQQHEDFYNRTFEEYYEKELEKRNDKLDKNTEYWEGILDKISDEFDMATYGYFENKLIVRGYRENFYMAIILRENDRKKIWLISKKLQRKIGIHSNDFELFITKLDQFKDEIISFEIDNENDLNLENIYLFSKMKLCFVAKNYSEFLKKIKPQIKHFVMYEDDIVKQGIDNFSSLLDYCSLKTM